MKNKVLLDKNVIIDIIARRDRKEQCINILESFDEFFITTNTFTTCFYVLRKDKFTKEEIYEFLTKFELLEIDISDCHLAYNLATNIDDIEDCLELFTAKRNNCSMITADKLMIVRYGELFDLVEVN